MSPPAEVDRVTTVVSVAGVIFSGAIASCTGSPQAAQPTSSPTSDGHSQHSQPSSTDGAQGQTVWASLVARPLHLPHVPAGPPCPVTRHWSSRRTADLRDGILHQPLLGPGPVYPGVATNLARWHGDVVMQMAHPQHPAFFLPRGWVINKVLWGVSRSYRGPVLIRGGQVDGTHRMLFYGIPDQRSGPHMERQSCGSWGDTARVFQSFSSPARGATAGKSTESASAESSSSG
jgi:hypothetical protein